MWPLNLSRLWGPDAYGAGEPGSCHVSIERTERALRKSGSAEPRPRDPSCETGSNRRQAPVPEGVPIQLKPAGSSKTAVNRWLNKRRQNKKTGTPTSPSLNYLALVLTPCARNTPRSTNGCFPSDNTSDEPRTAAGASDGDNDEASSTKQQK